MAACIAILGIIGCANREGEPTSKGSFKPCQLNGGAFVSEVEATLRPSGFLVRENLDIPKIDPSMRSYFFANEKDEVAALIVTTSDKSVVYQIYEKPFAEGDFDRFRREFDSMLKRHACNDSPIPPG